MVQAGCFASLAMTTLKNFKERERDHCKLYDGPYMYTILILQRSRSLLIPQSSIVIVRSEATKQPDQYSVLSVLRFLFLLIGGNGRG